MSVFLRPEATVSTLVRNGHVVTEVFSELRPLQVAFEENVYQVRPDGLIEMDEETYEHVEHRGWQLAGPAVGEPMPPPIAAPKAPSKSADKSADPPLPPAE